MVGWLGNVLENQLTGVGVIIEDPMQFPESTVGYLQPKSWKALENRMFAFHYMNKALDFAELKSHRTNTRAWGKADREDFETREANADTAASDIELDID